jgi:hypothetical protein
VLLVISGLLSFTRQELLKHGTNFNDALPSSLAVIMLISAIERSSHDMVWRTLSRWPIEMCARMVSL